MKLGESPVFIDLCKATLDFYEWWDENADIQSATKRAIVAGMSESQKSCMIIFKGTQEDCEAIKKLLNKRDRK